MRGRKPKPTAIKIRNGNPGKRPLNEAEPRFEVATLRVPRRRLPPEGQRLYKLLAEQLDQAGVLKNTDLPALEMLCLHFAAARYAWADAMKEGKLEMTSPTRDGEKKNPVLTVFRENSAALKSYLVEFGLTPSSRARIKGDQTDQEKSLADLLFEEVEIDGGQ